MTDNEIIKALERMSAEDADGFSSDILDLIKRQQAEIERLKSNNGATQHLLSEAWESIEEKDKWAEKRERIAKSEAITEFAERLKAEILEWQYEFEYYDERKKAAKQVDNLVKEMTEDKR